MFCPNYKNKEVFDGFNEVVKAFGGRPMTEEEFRDSALRNQRTGSDYVAMETAYQLYHKNGGNFLDQTPDGKTSILFQSLLEHFNGDRSLAIQAKSRVYSDAFIAWFGDWKNDPTNASKVVDGNGEPLVVYHSTRANFNTFDLSKSKSGDGFWFKPWKDDSTVIGKIIEKLSRSHDIPVYLNIKNPVIVDKPSGYKSGDIYTRKGIDKHSTSNNDGAIGFSNMHVFKDALNISDIKNKLQTIVENKND